MAVIIVRISVSIISLLLLSLADTSPETVDLCHQGSVSGGQANLNMNASFLAGIAVSCSCEISMGVDARTEMFTLDVQSTNCKINIELSFGSHRLLCKNGSYDWDTQLVYYDGSTQKVQMITKSNSSKEEQMWGSVKIYGNTTVALKCSEPKSTSSSTTMTTVATSTLTPSTTKQRSSTSGESTDAMPANEELKGVGNDKVPVALIAGCGSGGIILVIVLVILAVACYRRNKKLHQTREGNTRTPPFTHGDNDDEYLSMENELYNSSGDQTYTAYPRKSELKDLFNEVANKTPRDTNCTAPTELVPAKSDGMKTDGVKSQNEDLYQLVHKPRNVNRASPSQLNHNTAPSGDVYAIVAKS